VIWPEGFTAERQGDEIALVDETGAMRAVTGDALLVGGGLMNDKSPVWGACGQIEVVPTSQSSPSPSSSPPGLGISLAEAITIARQNVQADATLWGYAAGTYRDVNGRFPGGDRLLQPPDGATWDTLTWSIVFEGMMVFNGPSGAALPTPRPGLAAVFLDMETGRWLTTAAYSPNGALPTPYRIAPDGAPPVIYVSNGTALPLTVAVNGQTLAISEPGSVNIYDPAPYEAPWNITLSTPSSRTLVDFTYDRTDVFGPDGTYDRVVGQRVDLSCGRLDVFVGGGILGPSPFGSYPPGDCDP
jgi:hypothetical protein